MPQRAVAIESIRGLKRPFLTSSCTLRSRLLSFGPYLAEAATQLTVIRFCREPPPDYVAKLPEQADTFCPRSFRTSDLA